MIKNTIYNEDCIMTLGKMPDEYIDLVVTSPPYFNAREYSQYPTVQDYMATMKDIFTQVYKKLKNHKNIVVNVGDVIGQVGKARWSKQKLPLGAYFIVILEEIGFTFIDDYIWDKGEPQSKRHIGNPPYPFYQYPVNVYEHILVFEKNELDKTKIPCPVCNETITVSNSQQKIGVQSWECKNPSCSQKSASGRGKRFSARSIMMEDYKKDENFIPESFIEKWRRDIVKINPVIKINSKKDNVLGHTAPYPEEIVEMAVRYYTGIGDLVYDPFMGSGTTALVAKNLKRNYVGSEIHEEYVQLAEKRIAQQEEE